MMDDSFLLRRSKGSRLVLLLKSEPFRQTTGEFDTGKKKFSQYRMKSIFSIVLIAIVCNVTAQDFADYKFAEFKKGDRVLPYRIMLPLSFDSSKQYPLIIFLHGALQKGTE